MVQPAVRISDSQMSSATSDWPLITVIVLNNNDTWLESACLEKLIETVESMDAQAGTPLMLNYEDDSIQSSGGAGFDIFGLMSLDHEPPAPREVFVVGGCSYLIRRELFEKLG